ncbi:hypothetical protein [Corynebacterium nuruki]|uniref:hypothetical protein n=1 Tax=Corynebacterium nuruki TaxID=1032851 RepID=UPI0039BF40E2
MAHLPPSVALSTCETALRQLLTFVLSQKHGLNWLTAVVSADKLVKWQERKEVEAKKRTTRGVATVPPGLLDYAEFHELVDLVNKRWNEVAPALGKKAVTGALLERFDDLRNTVAHSRDLLPFEEDLLAGIAGEIRNRVTLFMSTEAPSGEHFARIEEVVDSFGNRVDGLETLKSSNPCIVCEQVLNVGDVVKFRCRGTDPYGRGIGWNLSIMPNGHGGVDSAIGNDVELTLTVKPEYVSSRSYVLVRMVSDAEFHRWPEGTDGLTLFYYQINPPVPGVTVGA